MTEELLASFTLKNGTKIGGVLGRETWRILQELSERHPSEFASLLAIAEDRGESVPAAHRTFLRQGQFLGDTGEILEHITHVLLSAVQWTDERLILVNPFRVSIEEVGRRLD
jgi:hypothetical protein